MNYRDIQGINASGISRYMRSPWHYWRESPFNLQRVRSVDTPAMVFGRLCHALILTPELVEKEFVVLPEINRRTKVGKQEYGQFLDQNAWKSIITHDQYQEAVKMRDCMYASPAIRALLGNGCSEEPITWQREEGGVLCKAQLDYCRSGLVLDYKTTTDATEGAFSKSLANFGYHRQAAWYLEAAEKKYGERPKGVVFLVQEKECPEYINYFAIDSEAIEIGARECDEGYRGISERLASGAWSPYPQEIQPISLPHWYK